MSNSSESKNPPVAPADLGPSSRRRAWRWVPSLYFAEGVPYVLVMVVAGIMYKRLGISNTQIAIYTSWLYLPWAIKPFWSPLVDMLKTKRWWILVMQLLIGAGLAGVALTIPADHFFRYTLMFLWLLAFSSATHDIAADGFYMLSLSANDQAWFVGIRNTFYRLATIAGQGLLVVLAGYLETTTGLPEVSVEVHAIEAETSIPTWDPQVVAPPDRSGALRILVQTPQLDIGRSLRSSDEVRDVIQSVREWNIKHGFHEQEKDPATGPDKQKSSWLRSLEAFIQRHFGTDTQAQPMVGNIGIVSLTLAGALEPNESVWIQLQRTSGDKNITLQQGERFKVTPANCQFPMAAIIQLDRQLSVDAHAIFSARSGNSRLAWATSFYLMAAIFLAFCAYHALALPRPHKDRATETLNPARFMRDFLLTFISFFRKKSIVASIFFLLFYRFAEGQLVKIASLFLLDLESQGGLALTTAEVGFVYGTVGVLALLVGGILGGFLAARHGLKFWIWWMVLAMNLPNVGYVFLSMYLPDSLWVVYGAVAIEQFGYGFGFTAYMLYMLYFARGDHETAHYAICTGFMALSMMVPGAISGWLQELIGYEHFFIWILIATIPSFLVVSFLRIDPEFGKKG